jgi:O-antigen ligase
MENYGLIGNGFGIPFFDYDLVQELYSRLGSMGFFDPSRPNETYLSTGHNFFLTLAFTIGFIPALLIVAPFVSAFRYLLFQSQPAREAEFLLLSLTGASTWAAFNVIVELPHSAGLFWLIYFTAWGYFEWTASSRKEYPAT